MDSSRPLAALPGAPNGLRMVTATSRRGSAPSSNSRVATTSHPVASRSTVAGPKKRTTNPPVSQCPSPRSTPIPQWGSLSVRAV